MSQEVKKTKTATKELPKFFCPEFEDVYKVNDFGASKYEAWGWLKFNPVDAHFNHRDNMASVQRHLAHVSIDPTSKDSESGLEHILHAADRLLMEYTRIKRGLKV